jgi:hypothetical protein
VEGVVEIVNWEGSALFGPGSEWFWSMASFIVVIASLGGIYRQLRAQGSANAVQRIESLQGQYDSERMAYARLALALDLKYEERSRHTFEKARPLLDFFANLDDLHEAGYLSVAEIWNSWGRSIQVWTALLASTVERQRELENAPELYDGSRLLSALLAFGAKRTTPPVNLDAAKLSEYLDYAIESNAAMLRFEHEWKSGLIPAPPPADPAVVLGT